MAARSIDALNTHESNYLCSRVSPVAGFVKIQRPSLAAAITVLCVAWLLFAGGQAVAADGDGGHMIYNLDCTEFFMGSFGPPVPETIDKFVDAHAAAGVTHLFINGNAQCTSYRSDVWDAYWDGYDPSLGTDQPFFAGIPAGRIAGPDANDSHWFIAMHNLHFGGCDYLERMLQRARHNKIGAWVSMRMNDGHHGRYPDHPSHSNIWKSNPDWRLPYGLDYEQPEVREHHLKLVRELCSRYDIDGIELDFLRFWLYFRPGREHHGTALMMDFMQQARAATRDAEKRLGHPVQLAVRVPGVPWIARRHGLDAAAWGRAGLVDMIIAGAFWHSSNSDMPIETWKGLLADTDVEIVTGLGDALDSGASGRRTLTHEEMRGIWTSGLHRGADGVYTFNLFTGPFHRWPREDYYRLLTDAGSYATLSAGPRRHPLTIISPYSAGASSAARSLPYTGTHGQFRLHIGPRPTTAQEAKIEIVVTESDQPLDVQLNGVPCTWDGLVAPAHIQASGWSDDGLGERQAYTVPPDAISDGYNLVDIVSQQDVVIKWVEISIQSREAP